MMVRFETSVKDERWSTKVSEMQNGADAVAGWRDNDRTWQCGSRGATGFVGMHFCHLRRRNDGRFTVAKRYFRLRYAHGFETSEHARSEPMSLLSSSMIASTSSWGKQVILGVGEDDIGGSWETGSRREVNTRCGVFVVLREG
jgi:hypothetical protein